MTIFGQGFNALALVGASYAFGKSGRGDAEAEHKQNHLAEENFRKQKINEVKVKWHNLILSIKGCIKKIKQKHR